MQHARPTNRVRIADLIIDTGERRVFRGSEDLLLGKLTFDLLCTLAERAPDVVSQDDLARTIWAGRAVTPETIAQRIKLLRKALDDDARAPRYLRVLRGQGYQLIAPVEFLGETGFGKYRNATARNSANRRPSWYLHGQNRIFAVAAGVLGIAAVVFGTTQLRTEQVGGTSDPVARRLYLEAGEHGMTGIYGENLPIRLSLLERALDRDPEFALALIKKAEVHSAMALFPEFAANAQVEKYADVDHRALAREAARRAIGIAPELSAGYAAFGSIAFHSGNWQEAEAWYRQALERGYARGYGAFELAVGHLADAAAQLLPESAEPPDAMGSAFRIALFDALGEPENAMAEFEKGQKLFELWAEGHTQYFLTLAALPDGPSRAVDLLVEWGLAPPSFAADIESDSEQAIADMSRMTCENAVACIMAAAIASNLDAPDTALQLLQAAIDRQPSHLGYVWRPVFADVRRTDDFNRYVAEIGLVDYWNEYGWPKLCEPDGRESLRCN